MAPQGDEILDVMLNAPKYTKYIGGLVRDELPTSGQLLEIGSGNGQQTITVVPPGSRVTCIEPSPLQKEALQALGYNCLSDVSEYAGAPISGIFSLNCFEHIQDDVMLLSSACQHLIRGGRVVIYVPAMPVLYSSMDKHVGHVRRYTPRTLRALLEESGLRVTKVRYVDSLGVLLSLVYKVIPGATGSPSPTSLKIFDNFLLPISRFMDLFSQRIAGKNLLVVGEKP